MNNNLFFVNRKIKKILNITKKKIKKKLNLKILFKRKK